MFERDGPKMSVGGIVEGRSGRGGEDGRTRERREVGVNRVGNRIGDRISERREFGSVSAK